MEVMMSLQGSLETLRLPELLNLLAATNKTGELEIRGDGREGRLWLIDGRLTGFAVNKSTTPVDAIFDLLRVVSGSFSFTDQRKAPHPQPPEPVEPVLERATERLAEWRVIEKVVPSLDARAELIHDVKGDVELDPAEWSLVAAIGDGRTVGSIVERRKLGEFDGCKAVKHLVDAGLVRILTPEPARPYAVTAGTNGSTAAAISDGEVKVSPEVPRIVVPGSRTAPATIAGAVLTGTPSATEAGGRAPADKASEAAVDPASGAPGAEGEETPAEPGGEDSSPVADALDVDDSPSADSSASPAGGPEAEERGQRPTGDAGDPSAQVPERLRQSSPAEAGAGDPAADGEEPLNRGMLLKFLSSVRS
jgi:hypothetical protein